MNKRMHGTIWITEDNWKEDKRDGFYLCLKGAFDTYVMVNLDAFGHGEMRVYAKAGVFRNSEQDIDGLNSVGLHETGRILETISRHFGGHYGNLVKSRKKLHGHDMADDVFLYYVNTDYKR